MPGPIDFGDLVVIIAGALAVVAAADRYIRNRALAAFCAPCGRCVRGLDFPLSLARHLHF